MRQWLSPPTRRRLLAAPRYLSSIREAFATNSCSWRALRNIVA